MMAGRQDENVPSCHPSINQSEWPAYEPDRKKDWTVPQMNKKQPPILTPILCLLHCAVVATASV